MPILTFLVRSRGPKITVETNGGQPTMRCTCETGREGILGLRLSQNVGYRPIEAGTLLDLSVQPFPCVFQQFQSHATFKKDHVSRERRVREDSL